jgi:hypothetical protein
VAWLTGLNIFQIVETRGGDKGADGHKAGRLYGKVATVTGSEAGFDGLPDFTPYGRHGTPEEVAANVYTFIASDEASCVTGALWLADGGITPARVNVGDCAGDAGGPRGVLELEHGLDGHRNVPECPRVEGQSGR